jgi:hypothetical protein
MYEDLDFCWRLATGFDEDMAPRAAYWPFTVGEE